MKLLVFGGRHFGDNRLGHVFFNGKVMGEETRAERQKQWQFVQDSLNDLVPNRSGLVVGTGNAPGADTAGVDWAVLHSLRFKLFPADWNKFGKAAGMIRNKQMITEFKPDMAIGFPGGKGTANMTALLEKAGVETILVEYNGKG